MNTDCISLIWFAIGGGSDTGTRTLTRIEASSKKLNFTMIKGDGAEIGQFNLDSKR